MVDSEVGLDLQDQRILKTGEWEDGMVSPQERILINPSSVVESIREGAAVSVAPTVELVPRAISDGHMEGFPAENVQSVKFD